MMDRIEHGNLHAARGRFPEYATASALGRNPAWEFPEVAAHLAACDECRSNLAELLELLAPSYTGAAVASPVVARPDLTFLPPQRAPAPHSPWHWDELGHLIIALGEALAAALSSPPLAGAARGALLHTLTAADPSSLTLQATVEIWQDDQDQALAHLRVSVDRLANDPFDQSGITVTLATTDGEERATTDDLGQVEFRALPLATLASRTLIIGP